MTLWCLLQQRRICSEGHRQGHDWRAACSGHVGSGCQRFLQVVGSDEQDMQECNPSFSRGWDAPQRLRLGKVRTRIQILVEHGTHLPILQQCARACRQVPAAAKCHRHLAAQGCQSGPALVCSLDRQCQLEGSHCAHLRSPGSHHGHALLPRGRHGHRIAQPRHSIGLAAWVGWHALRAHHLLRLCCGGLAPAHPLRSA